MSQDADWTRFCGGDWPGSLDHWPVRLVNATAAAQGGGGAAAVQLVTAWPALSPSPGSRPLPGLTTGLGWYDSRAVIKGAAQHS
jgi:hypothetical protein